MAIARALRRLLRVRDLEEEQGRIALESAMGELHRLERVRVAAVEWDRRGRRLVGASARSGELPDRLAGLEETEASHRLQHVLDPMIAGAELEVADKRADYLVRRIERRQAATLIEEAEALETLDDDRRSQQALDDWFRNRQHRSKASAARPGSREPEWTKAP